MTADNDEFFVKWAKDNRQTIVDEIMEDWRSLTQASHGRATDEDMAEVALTRIAAMWVLHSTDDEPEQDPHPVDSAADMDEAIGADQWATIPGSRVLNWITIIEYRDQDRVDPLYRFVTSADVSAALALGLIETGKIGYSFGRLS